MSGLFTLGLSWFALAALRLSSGTPAGPVLGLTAATANVTGAPDSIRIDILRWSTDAEREKLISAWPRKSAFTTAIKEAATVGYLWSSSEVAGYALRCAGKIASADGSERIILVTLRPLGAMNDLWKPTGGGTPATYDFSVIELRVNAKGEGEGKVSLTGKIVPDSTAKMIVLENYDALPLVFGNVKSRAVGSRL